MAVIFINAHSENVSQKVLILNCVSFQAKSKTQNIKRRFKTTKNLM